jgi:glycosyltransferase involved in cell wall biosynthesis
MRQLEKRRLPELNPESVISLGGPWLEMRYRRSLSADWDKKHDWLVNRWIETLAPSSKSAILHCFNGLTTDAMRAAKRRSWITVLEITLPVVVYDLVEAERQRLDFENGGRFPKAAAEAEKKQREINKQIVSDYRAADYLIAQSWLTVDYLLRLGIPPQRIVLLPLGTDTSKFQSIIKQITSRPFRVLFVGSLGIRKGLHHLLEVWRQLDLPNAELILAGSIDKRQFGDQLLEKYKGIFRWLGFVAQEDLPKLYQDSDIFAFPSLAEGSTMVMHEAMASGLPCVITTNVGCTLRDGVEGFVIPVGDIDALKDRILQLYHSPELRRTMGAAARMRASQFTWEEYGRRLILAYQLIRSDVRKSASDILDMTKL